MKEFFKSFTHALNGLRLMFRGERNFYVHIFAAATTLVLSYALNISDVELTAIIICIALVTVLEMVNTSIEKLCDFIHPGQHRSIKEIKDISAAAVLVAALASLGVGMIIFLPKLVNVI